MLRAACQTSRDFQSGPLLQRSGATKQQQSNSGRARRRWALSSARRLLLRAFAAFVSLSPLSPTLMFST